MSNGLMCIFILTRLVYTPCMGYMSSILSQCLINLINCISNFLKTLLCNKIKLISRNQFNQKFKLMVEAPEYVIYSNTRTYTRAHWTRSVDAAHDLLIHGAKYSTFNERWLRFEFVISYHVGSDTISRNQLNQRLKLIVKALKYVTYSNIKLIPSIFCQ